MRAFFGGLALHFEALRLLARERRLRRVALVPFLLSLVVLALTTALIVVYAGEIERLVTGWLPAFEAGEWYSWIWVGPMQVLMALVGAVLFLLVAACALVAAFLLAGVLAAPFHEVLSHRVEVVLGAAAPEEGSGVGRMMREGLRALVEELKRALFFLTVSGAITVVGLVVPGAQLVAPAALALFTMLFLPLDYASYALDRRRVSFRRKRRWVLGQRARMLGYGAGAFATAVVPGLNFLVMPVLVVSGTLLALRHGPGEPQGTAAGAGPPGARS